MQYGAKEQKGIIIPREDKKRRFSLGTKRCFAAQFNDISGILSSINKYVFKAKLTSDIQLITEHKWKLL